MFDLDGTLLDTAPDLTAALNVLLAEERREALSLAAVRPHVSTGAIAVVRRGFPELEVGTAAFEALRLRFLDHYRATVAVHSRLFPGFELVLATLEHHALPWGIITNKAGWLTDPLLDALGLRARAACVVSGDTLKVRKPHPDPLLLAAKRIGVPAADCVYVGDALRDVQAARAAGMVPLGARYGYLNDAERPESWPVAGWLDEPQDLLPWLRLPLRRAAAGGVAAGGDCTVNGREP
ncbi:MAG: phosphoglycolate phosphatase [Gammaproteobacteria bacterium]|nr:phosphoglycolate phosphatase [Gammaproteobacteria bacterium]